MLRADVELVSGPGIHEESSDTEGEGSGPWRQGLGTRFSLLAERLVGEAHESARASFLPSSLLSFLPFFSVFVINEDFMHAHICETVCVHVCGCTRRPEVNMRGQLFSTFIC